MNIIVKTSAGNCIVRPDTTWEKDNEDFFPPDYIGELSFTPVLFARITKPGKSIGLRFASRYYNLISCGMLLYPENLMDGSPEAFAAASCIDHTSFLSDPLFDKGELGLRGFRILAGESEIFRTEDNIMSAALIENALSEASTRVYMRTGDIIAAELAPRTHLCGRSDGNICAKGFFGEDKVLDFNIIVD